MRNYIFDQWPSTYISTLSKLKKKFHETRPRPYYSERKLKSRVEIRGGTLTLEFRDLVSVVFSWAGVKCPFCLSVLICKIAGVEPTHKAVVRVQEEMLCTVCVWSAVSARYILAFMVIEALKLVLLHHPHTFKHRLLRLKVLKQPSSEPGLWSVAGCIIYCDTSPLE